MQTLQSLLSFCLHTISSSAISLCPSVGVLPLQAQDLDLLPPMAMVCAEDGEFLYDDLFENVGDGKLVINTSFHEMEERLERLSSVEKELRVKVEELEKQNETLQMQKDILIKNISCLFKTAQMEIARKDRQIKELNEENQHLKLQNSKLDHSTSLKQSMGTSILADAREHNEKSSSPSDVAHAALDPSSVYDGNDRKRARNRGDLRPSDDSNGTRDYFDGQRRQGRGGEIPHNHIKQQDTSCATDAFRERRMEQRLFGRVSSSVHKERSHQGEERVLCSSACNSKSRDGSFGIDSFRKERECREAKDREQRERLDRENEKPSDRTERRSSNFRDSVHKNR